MTAVGTLRLGQKTGPAREVIADRLMLMAGGVARSIAPLLPASGSGLIVTAGQPHQTVRLLRREFPNLVLGMEPSGCAAQPATPENPFVLPDDGLLQVGLETILQEQINAGASFAVTPTGYLLRGDARPLKAAVKIANMLDREDLVLYVPCDPGWLTLPDRRQFSAVLRTSRHPVALALGHQMNPLAERGVPEGLRVLCQDLPNLVLWRADLSAFDGLSYGAVSAAIGVRASQRHVVPPGRRGFSPHLEDRTPRVLVPGLLRYMRAGALQTLFASTSPPVCHCRVCCGAALDRFDESSADIAAADGHNVLALLELHEDLRAHAGQASGWWSGRLLAAWQEHQRVEAATSVKFELEPVLKVWLETTGSV